MKNNINKKKKLIRKARIKLKSYSNSLLLFIKSNRFAFIAFLLLILLANLYVPIPDYLKIIDSKNFNDILIVIIGSLSSILGIVVAVQLVAFELIRKIFSAFGFKDFFRAANSKYLFNTYFATIVINFIALLN